MYEIFQALGPTLFLLYAISAIIFTIYVGRLRKRVDENEERTKYARSEFRRHVEEHHSDDDEPLAPLLGVVAPPTPAKKSKK